MDKAKAMLWVTEKAARGTKDWSPVLPGHDSRRKARWQAYMLKSDREIRVRVSKYVRVGRG